jgi:NAD(P)-dependent dehydrogenase (short-subunit alcohol dehydrogenase family)
MELDGKVALITGAGNGIGAALARRFAAEGAAGLLLADLDGDAATGVAAEIAVAAPGTRVVARQVDVADRRQIDAMVAAATDDLGPIDLLCSNAGIGTGQGLDADEEAWARSWDVNVLAHVHAARAVIPGMVERGRGHVLATCSAAGLLTMVGDAPYSVTKHAAVAFAEWLAITYGPRGIRVSALCPQGVNTNLLNEGLEEGALATRIVRRAAEVIEPEQVADAVIAGLADQRFLILPHPDVHDHLRHKADDPDRWITALQRFAATVEGAG